jgi:phosphosulfolactate synthase (CoM biosynthesis protein A)
LAEASNALQGDAKVKATIQMLCRLIASADDPGSRVEAEVGRLRNELLGQLRAAASRVARLEQAAARTRRIADAIDAGSQGEPAEGRPE